DLVVHRLVKERLNRQSHPEREHFWQGKLPTIALHTSRRERVAVDAEREYMDHQRARLMEKRVGSEFTGVSPGLSHFRMFVQLNEVFVEGLVRLADMDDYYFLDEVRMVLRGRRSGQTFTVGQPVRVRLAGINMLKRQLDFQLLTSKSGSPAPRQ